MTDASHAAKDIHDRVTARTGDLQDTTFQYDTEDLNQNIVAGASNHDDTNFGPANTTRGNLTVKTITAPNLIAEYTHDTTGQLVQFSDFNRHTTSYGFSDSFATDNGANPPPSYTPPTFTNAYVTSTTHPNGQTVYQRYYFNSGKSAVKTDENAQSGYEHYVDSLDRLTGSWTRPISGTTNRGWTTYSYPSITQTNIAKGIASTTPSGCTSCRQDTVTYDSFGRQTRSTLASDPDGQTFSDVAYDTSSRVQSNSNPYRSTSDPTYGLETQAYDGVGRPTSNTHADGNIKATYYGASVSSNGGAASQLCSSATYGLGYPMLTVDEAGKKKADLGRRIWPHYRS